MARQKKCIFRLISATVPDGRCTVPVESVQSTAVNQLLLDWLTHISTIAFDSICFSSHPA